MGRALTTAQHAALEQLDSIAAKLNQSTLTADVGRELERVIARVEAAMRGEKK